MSDPMRVPDGPVDEHLFIMSDWCWDDDHTMCVTPGCDCVCHRSAA